MMVNYYILPDCIRLPLPHGLLLLHSLQHVLSIGGHPYIYLVNLIYYLYGYNILITIKDLATFILLIKKILNY